jgi:hypothetical protein
LFLFLFEDIFLCIFRTFRGRSIRVVMVYHSVYIDDDGDRGFPQCIHRSIGVATRPPLPTHIRMVPGVVTAASGGSSLFAQYRPFAILKPKNRKTLIDSPLGQLGLHQLK